MNRDAPNDELLLRFREAVDVEFRLLDLERWLTADRPEFESRDYWKKWTVCTMRLLRLVSSNPRLTQTHHDAAHAYLLSLHEGQP